MSVAIVELNRRRWLVGLTWRSFEVRPTAQQLRAEGADLEADWVTNRRGPDAIQAGFGAKPDNAGSTRGIYSMAATVADLQKQPWLGIYQLSDDLWWFIAVRDGHAILPHGDVIGTRAEIEDAREAYSGFEDWNFVEGSTADLAVLLDGADRKGATVEALNGPPPWLMPAIGIVTGVAIMAAAFAWWSHIAAERARLEQLARYNALRARQAAIRQLTILETMPTPDGWLASCRRAVEPLPVSVGGWQLGTFECVGKAAHVTWRRGPGATPAAAPPGDLRSNGDAIGQTIPLAESAAGENDAVPLRQAEARLYSLLLPIGAKVTLKKTTSEPSLPGRSAAKPLLPNEDFQIALPIAPFSVRWGSVPGLVLQSAASIGQGGWTMTGTIYGH